MPLSFEFLQLETLYWYMCNLSRIMHRERLLPIPEKTFRNSRQLASEKVRKDHVESLLYSISMAFNDKLNSDNESEKDKAFLLSRLESLRGTRDMIMMPVKDFAFSDEHQLTYSFRMDNTPRYDPRWSKEDIFAIHSDLFHLSDWLHAYRFMIMLDQVFAQNKAYLLPEPPDPIDEVPAYLSVYIEDIAKEVSRNEFFAATQPCDSRFEKYGFDVIFPEVVRRSPAVTEFNQKMIEKRRKENAKRA